MLSAVAGVNAASAADMAPRLYTKAPVPVAIVYDWTGFYIGGNVGYSWGRAATDGDATATQSVSEFRTAGPTLLAGFPVVTALAAVPLSGRSNVNGVIGGGQAVTTGNEETGWSVWKLTFRAVMSAEAPTSVSSPDARRARVS